MSEVIHEDYAKGRQWGEYSEEEHGGYGTDSTSEEEGRISTSPSSSEEEEEKYSATKKNRSSNKTSTAKNRERSPPRERSKNRRRDERKEEEEEEDGNFKRIYSDAKEREAIRNIASKMIDQLPSSSAASQLPTTLPKNAKLPENQTLGSAHTNGHLNQTNVATPEKKFEAKPGNGFPSNEMAYANANGHGRRMGYHHHHPSKKNIFCLKLYGSITGTSDAMERGKGEFHFPSEVIFQSLTAREEPAFGSPIRKSDLDKDVAYVTSIRIIGLKNEFDGDVGIIFTENYFNTISNEKKEKFAVIAPPGVISHKLEIYNDLEIFRNPAFSAYASTNLSGIVRDQLALSEDKSNGTAREIGDVGVRIGDTIHSYILANGKELGFTGTPKTFPDKQFAFYPHSVVIGALGHTQKETFAKMKKINFSQFGFKISPADGSAWHKMVASTPRTVSCTFEFDVVLPQEKRVSRAATKAKFDRAAEFMNELKKEIGTTDKKF